MSDFPKLRISPLPDIDLRHLFVLTDDTTILQHASRATPALEHGYCTDDTARALIAAVKLFALPEELWTHPGTDLPGANDVQVATQRYMAFLRHAFNADAGRFRNFMQYDRSWLEEVGSEDSHARTIWALGKTVRFAPTGDVEDLANELMLRSIPAIEHFEHHRPKAYALLGLDEYLRVRPDEPLARRLHDELAAMLYDLWKSQANDEWPWWEDELTWGNAKLPHAMLIAGMILDRPEVQDAALKALRWLLQVQTAEDGHLTIIGNHGWYRRGRKMAQYDQQPIEAKALIQACLAAATLTRDAFWTDAACTCFEWFLGRNDIGVPLYNPETGGGMDGLAPHGANLNQGAESTLAWLLSLLELYHYDRVTRGEVSLAAAPLGL